MKNIGDEFIEKTKKIEIHSSDQQRGVLPPPLQSPYPGNLQKIELPGIKDFKIAKKDLSEAINERQSIRNYLEKPMPLTELSYLLWCTQGVKNVFSDTFTKRTVPSAGSRHPLETYLIINKIKNLTPGIYRYLSLEHSLLKIQEDQQIMNKMVKICNNQAFVGSSAVVFIWSADIYRVKWRHGERAYRYIFLDAGHIAQNLYLSAECINCGVCAVSVFFDDEVNSLLSLDGKKQFVIYMATVGKRGVKK